MTVIRNDTAVETATTVELRVPSQPENVRLARLALSGVAAVAGVEPDELSDLKLAVSEVCTNAVLHAYPDGAEGEIVVRYTIGAEELTVEVIDAGVGFDPSAVAMEPIRDPSEGHVGLVIARAVTDRIEIDSGPSGTRVVFSRRRAS